MKLGASWEAPSLELKGAFLKMAGFEKPSQGEAFGHSLERGVAMSSSALCARPSSSVGVGVLLNLVNRRPKTQRQGSHSSLWERLVVEMPAAGNSPVLLNSQVGWGKGAWACSGPCLGPVYRNIDLSEGRKRGAVGTCIPILGRMQLGRRIPQKHPLSNRSHQQSYLERAPVKEGALPRKSSAVGDLRKMPRKVPGSAFKRGGRGLRLRERFHHKVQP